MRLELVLPALAAAAISAGIILADFGRTPIGWPEVVRPILVVAVVAAVIGLAAALVSRWLPAVRLPAMLAAVLLTVGLLRPLVALYILGGAAAWIGVRWGAHRLFGWGDGSAQGLMPAMALIGSLFAVVSFVGAVGSQGFPQLRVGATTATAAHAGESVYVLFLDGYPRADTLREDFGYDNEPFLRQLEQRGFVVDRQSESHYPYTYLALAQLLHVDLTDLNVRRRNLALRREVRSRLDDAPLLAESRAAGYEVTIIRPPIGHATIDGSLDTGHVTEFEVVLLGRSSLPFLVRDWIIGQQRDRLDAGLAKVVQLAQSGGSHIVLAHLMAPHPPFLTRPAPACWPNCGLWRSTGLSFTGPDGEYAAAVREQIEYLNPRVLSALDAIIAADPSASVMVFSDHGFRHRPAGHPEWERNLYAVRGQPAVEFGSLEE